MKMPGGLSLCRASGVPARWQSGWTLWPERSGLHDWAEIFVEPYGWLPVDVDYAVHFVHEYETLSADEKQEIIDFYFGGIDAHRLVINREHGYPLYPPKRFPRSDDVDFQRGELETDRGNLYYIADAAGGAVRVGVLDIDRMGLEDCTPIQTNVTDGLVTWGDSDTVTALVGRRIRLHFELRSAVLYAFDCSSGP